MRPFSIRRCPLQGRGLITFSTASQRGLDRQTTIEERCACFTGFNSSCIKSLRLHLKSKAGRCFKLQTMYPSERVGHHRFWDATHTLPRQPEDTTRQRRNRLEVVHASWLNLSLVYTVTQTTVYSLGPFEYSIEKILKGDIKVESSCRENCARGTGGRSIWMGEEGGY